MSFPKTPMHQCINKDKYHIWFSNAAVTKTVHRIYAVIKILSPSLLVILWLLHIHVLLLSSSFSSISFISIVSSTWMNDKQCNRNENTYHSYCNICTSWYIDGWLHFDGYQLHLWTYNDNLSPFRSWTRITTLISFSYVVWRCGHYDYHYSISYENDTRFEIIAQRFHIKFNSKMFQAIL